MLMPKVTTSPRVAGDAPHGPVQPFPLWPSARYDSSMVPGGVITR